MTLTEFLDKRKLTDKNVLILFKDNVYPSSGLGIFTFEHNGKNLVIRGGSRPLMGCHICIYIDAFEDLNDLNEDTTFHKVKDRFSCNLKSIFQKPVKTKFDKLFNSKFSILDQFEISFISASV